MRHTAKPTKTAEMKIKGRSSDSFTGFCDSISTSSFSTSLISAGSFSIGVAVPKPSLDASDTRRLWAFTDAGFEFGLLVLGYVGVWT